LSGNRPGAMAAGSFAGVPTSGESPSPGPVAADVPLPVSRAVAGAPRSADRPSSPTVGSAPTTARPLVGSATVGTVGAVRSGERSLSSSPAVGVPPTRSVEPRPVTQLARQAGVGSVTGAPSDRVVPLLDVPLLDVPRLARPVVAANSVPERVAPAVWRRPSAPAGVPVRPAMPLSGEPSRAVHGADIVAMAPVRPVRPSALPVTHVQRAPQTAGPPRARSMSAPPPVTLSPATSNTAKSSPITPPRSDPLDGIEIEKLARQLFEPISRLLRTDLRRGRERAGAGQDHRR